MISNEYKFNLSKIEFIIFGTAGMHKRLEPLLPANICRERFEAADSVWNLGVIFD